MGLFLMATLLPGTPGLAGQDDALKESVENRIQLSAMLTGILTDESAWEDATIEQNPKKVATLRSDLKWVEILRPRGLKDVLIRHLSFFPYLKLPLKLLTIEYEHPVVPCVIAYGPEMIPSLLAILKKVDPGRSNLETRALLLKRQSRWLAILCIRDIYEKGGREKDLARKRISLEAGSAEGKEKEWLLHALNEGVLKKD